MSLATRLREIAESRAGVISAAGGEPYAGRAMRNDFLRWLYANRLVTADEFSAHLADKLFFAKMLETYAPAAYARFHPRTFTPSELGPDHGLILSSYDLVAKPAAAMNGEGGEVYVGRAACFAALKENAELFRGEARSALTGLLSSGHRYLVQERVEGTAPELRLHTLEGRVVKGGTYTRWDTPVAPEFLRAGEAALQEFLDLLPPWLKGGQAWSVDFLKGANGFRIIEVNTNRGAEGQWSGDLSLPDLLAAYVWHLEEHYGIHFAGPVGEDFRGGRANLAKYIAKFGEDAWAKHRAIHPRLFPLTK